MIKESPSLFSYILRIDDGAAPNPYWNICTLTICKPVIRRTAKIGDWVIGTGSKNSKCNDGFVYDLSDCIVYAMKITDIKGLKEYDSYCNKELKNKIPDWKNKDWKNKIGDCIYDYSNGLNPTIRKGVHNEDNRQRDLSGEKSLLSNNFFYFGEDVKPIPYELKEIIKQNQGHKKIENIELILKFEKWINKFENNKIYADPQMRWYFDKQLTDEDIKTCAKTHYEEDIDDTEVRLC
jgi:hypothetical protein